MSLRTKLLALAIAFAVVPLLAASIAIAFGIAEVRAKALDEFKSLKAGAVQDRIDRCLFERYGDAQAFALNPAFNADWVQPTEAQRAAATAMADRLATTYGVYPLVMVVSASGRVVAANTVGHDAKPVDTTALIGRDVSPLPWFIAARDGRFTTDADCANSTVVTDPERDALVAEVYGARAPRFCMTFTAPIAGAAGAPPIGYIHNVFSGGVIEDIIIETQAVLAAGEDRKSVV